MSPGPRLVALVLTASALLAGCTATSPPSTSELRAQNPTEPCGELPAWTMDPRYNPRMRLRTSVGHIDLEMFVNSVPFVAGHTIMRLAAEGYYDNLRFHRVLPGVSIYAGDPNSRDAERRDRWGFGGPGFRVPDDFHQFLRFDEPYMVGLATNGPNTGGSQFFITLKPLPGLSDRQTVVGRVVQGSDVVEAIAHVPVYTANDTGPQRTYLIGQPKQDVFLFDAFLLEAPSPIDTAPVGLSLAAIDCVERAAPGTPTHVGILARNTGQRLLNTTWSLDAPTGWTASLLNRDASFPVPAGQTTVLVFSVTPPEGFTEATDVTFRFTTPIGASDALTVTVRPGPVTTPVMADQMFLVDYIGVLEDGRVFDASDDVAFDGVLDSVRNRTEGLAPLTCRLAGDGVECLTARPLGGVVQEAYGSLIPGFADAVKAARLQQAMVVEVPAERAYGDDEVGPSGLGGRTLYYHVVVRRAVG